MTQVIPAEEKTNGLTQKLEDVESVDQNIDNVQDVDEAENQRPKKQLSKRAKRKRCRTIFNAVLTRLLFVAHSLVAVWRAAEVAGQLWWLLLLALTLLLIESVITVVARKGKEWKLFCPSVLFFLIASVPAIWLMEVDKLSRYNTALNNTVSNLNTGSGSGLVIKLPISLDDNSWILAIEQSMMIILILGRWLLPKGRMSREELSAMLLVYVGLAADIIELFDIFEEPSVLKNHYFIYAVLAVWSWSLLQFVFVVSASGSGQGIRLTDLDTDDEPLDKNLCRRICCSWEVWSIIWSVLLQDGPFLAIRLTAIIMFSVYTYSNFFFTAKNLFVVVLQTYRLFSVTCCVDEGNDDDEEEEEIIK